MLSPAWNALLALYEPDPTIGQRLADLAKGLDEPSNAQLLDAAAHAEGVATQLRAAASRIRRLVATRVNGSEIREQRH